MLFMVYPQMVPSKGQPVGSGGSVAEVNRNMMAIAGGTREGVAPSAVGSVSTAGAALQADRFEPRMFGFRMHEEARLARWRTAKREE